MVSKQLETSTESRPERSALGIVGGGQLGRMMVEAARNLDVNCTTLDPESESPAAQVGSSHITGSLFDAAALTRLVTQSAVTTFEIEATDAEVLERLETQGHVIRPRPKTLKLIQKHNQQDFLMY